MATYGAWRADASSLGPGSIVMLKNPAGSRGGVTHNHWFVIITPPRSQVRLGTRFSALGISSALRANDIDPSVHYPMPYLDRKGGHSDTGFTKPCYACLNWPTEIEVFEGDENDLEVRADASERRFLDARDTAVLIELWTRYMSSKKRR